MRIGKKQSDLFSHPYILLILGCLLVYIAFPQGNSENILKIRSIVCLTAPLAAAAVWQFFLYCKKWTKKGQKPDPPLITIKICLVICILCLIFLFWHSPYQLEMLASVVLLILGVIALWAHIFNHLTPRLACILLGAAAFSLHAVYILYTAYLVRQHDVLDIQSPIGHQAYMLYFVNHNFALPNFDPRSVWEFYHPPLHYWVSALWIKLQMLFGTDPATAVENVQYLTLFYSCAALIISYRILRILQFDGAALIVSFAILCLHPSLILLSGSINNDMLGIVLSFAAILYALRWYQNPTRKNILLLALWIGLSMMAKSSGILAAPAVAFLFLRKFLKAKDSRLIFWKQFGLFLAVSIPLGLWWSIYCKIRFGMPIGAVTGLQPDNPQYLGHDSPIQRLFGMDWHHFSVFENWNWQGGVFEYNLWIALLKTALFDEAELFVSGPGLIFSQMLFGVNVLLAAGMLVCIILSVVYAWRKKAAIKTCQAGFRPFTLFFTVLFVTYLLFYIGFCFREPYACTQNFRYIVPTLLPAAAAQGAVLKHNRLQPSQKSKALTWTITLLSTAFCILSAFVYLLAGCSTAL